MASVSWDAWLNNERAMHAVRRCSCMCYRLLWSDMELVATDFAQRKIRDWLSGWRTPAGSGSVSIAHDDPQTPSEAICTVITALVQRDLTLLPAAENALDRIEARFGHAAHDELTREVQQREEAIRRHLLSILTDGRARSAAHASAGDSSRRIADAARLLREMQSVCRREHCVALTHGTDMRRAHWQ